MDFLELKHKRVAIVADWLIDFWGAELVISELLSLFPDADIYTSVCFMKHPMLEWRKVYTSWIQHIPFLNKRHKLAGILRPFAFRSFDMSGYDIILSSSSAESKNIGFSKRKPGAKHFCYCHTPIRYYWSHYEEYRNMMEFWFLNPLARFVLDMLVWWLRKLDLEAAERVDFFLANSQTTKNRISTYYKMDSTVLYPWIHTDEFSLQEKEDFYLSIGRCIPYKKFDLLVDAFNANGKKLILVTNTDNLLFQELKKKSKPNIEWKLHISKEERNSLYSKARAFLFPPLEDFWLVPVESMASGTPVIAFWVGWATETVVAWETGLFFAPQTPEALNTTIEKFEQLSWDAIHIQEHAKKFSTEQFKTNLITFIWAHAE